MAYKVLVINGSPRPNGCTATALNEVIRALHEEGGAAVNHVLAGEEHAEAGLEVVIAGGIVIEAEAFRARAEKPNRDERHDIGELLLQHGAAVFLEIRARELEARHRSSPPAAE